MKKVIALILSIMIVMVGTVTVATAVTNKKVTKKPVYNANLSKKLKKPDVYGLYWYDPQANEMNKKWEKLVNGKLHIIQVAADQMELKAITMIASGSQLDYSYIMAFPKYTIKNLLQPIEPYFDLNDPFFIKKGMEDFKYKGRYYGVTAFTGISPTLVYYNKQMFKDNGLTTPLEYYKKGKWNFENFRKLAMALTQDTNGDGKVDQWGFGSSWYDPWVIANGGNIVKFYNNGAIKLTFNDPKTLHALGFVQDLYYKYKCGTSTTGTDLPDGKIAMMVTWAAALPANGSKTMWDVVPFPVGPENKTGQTPGSVMAYGIYKGAKNPIGAASYIYYRESYNAKTFDEQWKSAFNKEQLIRVKAVFPKVKTSLYQGIGNIANIQYDLWGDIMAGKSIAATCTKYAPIWQKEINLTIKDNKLPSVKPFNGAPVIDFENGIGDVDLTQNYGVQSAAITKDSAEVIGGNSSLKITAKNDAGWQQFFLTSPTVVKLPLYHTYKITFDYKALSDCAADGYYYIRINGKPASYYGWNVLGPLKAGDKGTFEGTSTIGEVSTDNSVVLGGYNAGSIVVDNIKITEAP